MRSFGLTQPFYDSTLTEIGKANKVIINASSITPAINLIPEKKYLIIKGRSCPENALNFYTQVYHSIDSYISTGQNELKVFFNLEYFNTSSAKCIFDLFKKLDVNSTMGVNVIVNWYYEEGDDDMLETGEDYSEFFKFKFNLVPFQLND